MIDLTRPFRLKKMIVDPKTGNTYVPLTEREYLPGEVPGRLLNASNCIQEFFGAIEDIAPNPQTIVTREPVIAFDGINTPAKVIEPSIEYKEGSTPTALLHPEVSKAETPSIKKSSKT